MGCIAVQKYSDLMEAQESIKSSNVESLVIIYVAGLVFAHLQLEFWSWVQNLRSLMR